MSSPLSKQLNLSMALNSVTQILKSANLIEKVSDEEKLLEECSSEESGSVDFRSDSELGDVVRNYVKDAFSTDEGHNERIKLEVNSIIHKQTHPYDEENYSNDSSIYNKSTIEIPRGKSQCADCGKIVDAKFLHNHMQYVHRNVVHRKGRKGTLLPAAKKEKPPDHNNGPYFFEKDIGIQCSLAPDENVTFLSNKRKLGIGWRESDSLAVKDSMRKGVRDSSFQTMYQSLASDYSPKEPVIFVCFRCFQDFPTRDLLEEHLLKTHNNDDNLVKCHKCKEWVPFQSYKSHPRCWSPKSSVLTKEGKYNVLTIGERNDGLDEMQVMQSVTNDDISDEHSTVTLSFSDENGIQTTDYLSMNDDGQIVQSSGLDSTNIADNNMRIYQLDPGDMDSLDNLENGQEEIITDNQGQIVIIQKGEAYDHSHEVDPDSGKIFFEEQGNSGEQVLDVGVGMGVELNERISCPVPLTTTAFLDLHSGEAHAVLNLHGRNNTQELGENASVLGCPGDNEESVLDPSGDDSGEVLNSHAQEVRKALEFRSGDAAVLDLREKGPSALSLPGEEGASVLGDGSPAVPGEGGGASALGGSGGAAVLGLRDNGTSALGLRGDENASVLGGGAALTGTATKLSLRTQLGMEGEEETTATIVLGKANEGSVQLPVCAEDMQLGQEYVDLATGTKYMVVIEENSDPNSGKIILQP